MQPPVGSYLHKCVLHHVWFIIRIGKRAHRSAPSTWSNAAQPLRFRHTATKVGKAALGCAYKRRGKRDSRLRCWPRRWHRSRLLSRRWLRLGLLLLCLPFLFGFFYLLLNLLQKLAQVPRLGLLSCRLRYRLRLGGLFWLLGL